MSKAWPILVLALLTACASSSPVRKYFELHSLRYPVSIAPPRGGIPLLTDINQDPPERPAPQYSSFLDSAVRNLRVLASYSKLRQLAPSAEAFALGPPYLWQDSPEQLCVAVPFSAFEVADAGHREIYIPMAHHSVDQHTILEVSNILLVCPSGQKWELLCCSL